MQVSKSLGLFSIIVAISLTTVGASSHASLATKGPAAAPQIEGSIVEDAAYDFDMYREKNPVRGYSAWAVLGGPGGKGIIFYISGDVEPSAAEEIDSLRKKYGIEIEVRDTPFEYNYLVKSLDELLPNLLKIPQYASIGPTKDRQAISIGVEGELTDSVRNQFEEMVGQKFPDIPILFKADRRTTKAQLLNGPGRFQDTTPYRSGSQIVDAGNTNSWCTLGFRARRASTSSWVYITAAHCMNGNSSNDNWLAGNYPSHVVGTEGTVDYGTDTMILIPTSSTTNYMYYGAYNATTTQPVPVGYDPGIDTTVYLDGAIRGQNSYTVTDKDLYRDAGPLMELIVTNDLYWSTGHGDSGGPVYNIAQGHAVGRGVIHAGRTGTEGTCSQGMPNPPAPYNVCYWDQYASQINAVETALGVAVQ